MLEEERPREFAIDFGNVEALVTFTRAVLVKRGQQQLKCSKFEREWFGEAVETVSRAVF